MRQLNQPNSLLLWLSCTLNVFVSITSTYRCFVVSGFGETNFPPITLPPPDIRTPSLKSDTLLNHRAHSGSDSICLSLPRHPG